MADRGFTIKDMLKQLKIELNLPPFMEGRKQLPAEEVQEGRNIASLRIHVERAIGRLKNFGILSGTIPLSLSWLTNQIVHVCAFLCNFQPALVPSPQGTAESDVTVMITLIVKTRLHNQSALECIITYTVEAFLTTQLESDNWRKRTTTWRLNLQPTP